jgi:hypothetical protein
VNSNRYARRWGRERSRTLAAHKGMGVRVWRVIKRPGIRRTANEQLSLSATPTVVPVPLIGRPESYFWRAVSCSLRKSPRADSGRLSASAAGRLKEIVVLILDYSIGIERLPVLLNGRDVVQPLVDWFLSLSGPCTRLR